MIKSIKLFIPMILVSGMLFSQTIQGNWDLNAAIVEWTYEVREFDSPEDTANGSYAVTASWPSSAAAAAGMGYTHTLLEYDIGDTIAVSLVPLINETLLGMFGVAMDVDLNDDGTFTINDGSTYPTTDTENCSTYATVPSVAENGTWSGGSGFTHPDDENAYSMGWGISLSSVFAQFGAADLANGQYGVDYGVGTDMENWGMVTIDYEDADHTSPTDLEIYWEAHDGTASGLGVNDAGQLNGFTGIPVSPGDTVTISNTEAYLAYVHSDTMLWYMLGWTGSDEPFSIPILGGTGHPVDPTNPDSYTIDPLTGDTLPAGTVATNHGYLFDPAAGDGIPFSGDEPLAATGFFFTYNFMEAAGIFPAVLNAHLAAGAGLEDALAAASDSVAFIYVDAETAAAIGASVASSLYADYVACLGTGASADVCAAVLEAGPTMTLIGVQQACDYDCGVDDSGWDYDPEYETGRLVFEVDNSCIPDNTTQRVNTFWTYDGAAAELDEDAPLAEKFELYGNFPNPFNPSTKIRFATEKFSDVKVTIYSILGEEVAVSHDGELSAGTYDITWYGHDHNGNKVPSGVYFYEVRSDNRIQKGKMLLLK
jgi:hypothetical protein